jgi:hypothetical protein
MMRMAALPVESLGGLRFPDSVAWADSVIAERGRLAAEGRRLGDTLHDHIGGQPDDRVRRALIAARRQIFNNRLPKDPPPLDGLPGDLAAELEGWLSDRAALERRLATGPDVLAEELRRSRLALRELAAEPRLRRGLLLASPSLDTYLDQYRTSQRATLSKRGRRLERTLLEYLYRIAYKTSPFSTFTGLAVGEFAEAGQTSPFAGRIGAGWHSHPRLNVAVLDRLSDLIVANADLRADLLVRLTPGWKSELDRIRYVRRSVSYGDDSATVGFDLVQTDVYYLNRSASLERTLQLLEREPRLRFRDFVQRIRDAEGASVAECEHWAQALHRLGLLEVADLRLNIYEADAVRGFAARLRRPALSWANDLAARMEGLADRIDAYAQADVPQRRTILAGLRDELTAIQRGLGADDATLPQTLLYEDVRLDADGLAIGRRPWNEQVGTALNAVSTVLPAFDLNRPQQLLLKAFFLIRYGRGGRCDDLLQFILEFQEDIYDQYMDLAGRQRSQFDEDGRYTGLNNWLNSPEIAALEQARQRFADGMREAWAALPDGATELVLGEEFLAAVAKELAPAAPAFAPAGHFVQLARTPGGPLAVLNQSFGALSFPFSRFTHCFAESGLAAELRAENRTRQPDGAVFAEVVGGVLTTNLNLHDRLTDYQLVCPGETGSVPADEQIALADLYLEHDETDDRVVLRSRRLGREVIPVYLGYLLPMVLPAILRILLLFSPSSMATPRPWDGVPAREPVDGVTSRPRIRFANVVLQRRSWTVEADRLPARQPEDTDAAWFLCWRSWQRAHGLPEQVFARYSGGTDPKQPAWRESKPNYVDFGSFHSLVVFDHQARSVGGRIRMEEMLPTEDQLYVTSDQGRHVAEMTVETTKYERSTR